MQAPLGRLPPDFATAAEAAAQRAARASSGDFSQQPYVEADMGTAGSAGPAGPAGPYEDPPVPEGEPPYSQSPKAKAARARRQADYAARQATREAAAKALREWDPFKEIEHLNQTGGIDGQTPRMNTRQLDALRTYCLLEAPVRTQVRLGQALSERTGKPQRLRTLSDWSRRFHWEALAQLYDRSIDNVQVAAHVAARLEADERQAAMGRTMQGMAADTIRRIITEAAEPQRPVLDANGKPIVNPRTGKPQLTPKKGYAGLQGAAVLLKVGTEMERTALGMPTQIREGTMQMQQQVSLSAEVRGALTHDHTHMLGSGTPLSLDEWRNRTARERGEQPQAARLVRALGGGGGGRGGRGGRGADELPALPAPAPAPETAKNAPHAPHDLHDPDAALYESLEAAELEQLPDEWLAGRVRSGIAGPVVEADSAPPQRATGPTAEDEDAGDDAEDDGDDDEEEA